MTLSPNPNSGELDEILRQFVSDLDDLEDPTCYFDELVKAKHRLQALIDKSVHVAVSKTVRGAEELAQEQQQEAIDAARKEIAKQIWEDEQKANEALAKLPIGTADYELMSGRILGLQRSRDIVEASLTKPPTEEAES